MSSETFAALVLSLPSRDKTVRMRIWRALHGIGCGVLRDGVYLLPSGAAQVSSFADLEADVKAAGGFAMTVELNLKAAQIDQVRSLFDRTDEYASLVARINAAKKSLARLGQPRAVAATGVALLDSGGEVFPGDDGVVTFLLTARTALPPVLSHQGAFARKIMRQGPATVSHHYVLCCPEFSLAQQI